MFERHYDEFAKPTRMKRTVLYVSESTGITAETVGHSLLSQFEGIDFKTVYMPYDATGILGAMGTMKDLFGGSGGAKAGS